LRTGRTPPIAWRIESLTTATLPETDCPIAEFYSLPELNLPPGAPKVKLTAEIGPVKRQSWHLRRPVTFLGSADRAHIQFREASVAGLHCAIVNTGTSILVRDLGGRAGTQLNERPIELACLADGDILTLGGVTVMIAIQATRENAKGDRQKDGLPCPDPLRMPIEMMFREFGGARSWPITNAVATVGRREECDFFLDHPDIAPTQAILTCVGEELVVYDLEDRTGTLVNGLPVTVSVLSPGDPVQWGHVAMTVETAANRESVDAQSSSRKKREPSDKSSKSNHILGLDLSGLDDAETQKMLQDLETKISTLQANINNAWQELSERQSTLEAREAALVEVEQEIKARNEAIQPREAELEARSAELEKAVARVEEQQNRLKADLEEIETRRREADEAVNNVESRQAQLDSEEALLQQRNAEAEQAVSDLESKRTELESGWEKLEAAQSKLDTELRQLAEQTKSLESREAALATDQEGIAVHSADLERREKESEAQLQELAAQREAIKAESQDLEKRKSELAPQLEAVERQSAEFERREAEWASKTEQLAARAGDLEARESALADEREALDAHTAELEQREAELATQRETLDAKTAVFDRREAEIVEQSEEAQRLNEAVEASRQKLEALRSEIEQRGSGLSELEKTLVEREKTVAGQSQTHQLFKGLIENAVESFDQPILGIGDEDDDGSAHPRAKRQEDDLDGLDVDDKTREKIRVLRRMGNTKSAAELLEKIREQGDASSASGSSGDEDSKKSWWSRLT